MLLESVASLEKTHRFLDEQFVKWGALRDERNELVYLNDELRISDEPLGTLMCMAFRVTRSWQLTSYDEKKLFGIELSLRRLPTEHLVMQPVSIKKLRMMILIDLVLWHIFHNGNKVTTWVRTKNTHALFEGKPPLRLLSKGNLSVIKVIYAYLCNISP